MIGRSFKSQSVVTEREGFNWTLLLRKHSIARGHHADACAEHRGDQGCRRCEDGEAHKRCEAARSLGRRRAGSARTPGRALELEPRGRPCRLRSYGVHQLPERVRVPLRGTLHQLQGKKGGGHSAARGSRSSLRVWVVRCRVPDG